MMSELVRHKNESSRRRCWADLWARAQRSAALLSALVFALVFVCAPSVSMAQGDEPAPLADGDFAFEDDDDPDAVKKQEIESTTMTDRQKRLEQYIASNQDKITVYQVVQEMIDDFVADTRDLNLAAISPVAIRGVGMTPNLSGSFGLWVEAQLTNALSRHTDIRVKRCISCQALKTRMDGNDWVVTLGHVSQEELAREAKNLGVTAFADAYIAYIPGANVVSMNIQIYRASDGKILWTETYQSDATTAAILRSGDRVLSRDEAREELIRKIEQRPYYGYQLMVGFGAIPYDSPTASSIQGLMIGGRLYEKWGEDKRFLYGLHAESFLKFGQNAIAGGFVGATIQYQLNQPNLNEPIYRAGATLQGFIAGSEGNSFAVEANVETILQFRYGASLGVFYFVPTQFAGADLGGVGAKGRFLVNW